MTHNDIVNRFKKKRPKGSFYHFWGKSGYKEAPWDVTFIFNNRIHIIEFKKGYDKLKEHQKDDMMLAANNTDNIYPWVIQGALMSRRQLIKDYIRLKDLNGNTIIDGKYQTVMDFLTKLE